MKRICKRRRKEMRTMCVLFLPILLFAISGVFGVDFKITCPPRLFEGVQYSVLCQVNRTRISTTPGICEDVQSMSYQLGYNNVWTSAGTASYPACTTSIIKNVRCVNVTAYVSTYELLFTPVIETQNGLDLRCYSDCESVVTIETNICKLIMIEEKPPARHNCPKYVIQGQNVTCTCAGGPDMPPGVFRWASNSESAILTLTKVLKSQNGTQYRCQAVWSGGTVESEDVYTLNVAYGPDSASATAPDPFNTNGSLDMTLTCSASNVNPAPTFTWTRNGSSDVMPGELYTFKPHLPADDGSVFWCHALNTENNITSRAAVTVNLNYPPNTDPVITNNSTDGNLYEGDSVTFICTVTGGKPVNATSVTFTCPGKHGTTGTVGFTGVVSRLTFNSVIDSDHNTQCTCNTVWKNTTWYSQSVHTTLFVNAPPSPPRITVTDGVYPPVAGSATVRFTLTCVSDTPGRPTANYTWTVTGKGQPSVDRQNRTTLTFNTIGRDDDGKTVTCKASNLYSINRQPVTDGNFTLNVYYHPEISLSPHQDNACHMSTSFTCEVTEGQNVSILCNADSNPAPKTFTWHKDGGTLNQFPVGSHLYIVAANHMIDNGKYNCTVTTGDFSDGRQSLTSTQQLTVLVKYKPSKSQLAINTRKNVTVNEADHVDFVCLADGIPTPNLELRNDNGIVRQLLTGGDDVVLKDKETRLNHSMAAECQHAGVYRCTSKNSVGEGPSDSAMLYVNCKPRAAEPHTEPLPVNFVGDAVQISLDLVAYPHNLTYSYFGPVDNRSSSREVAVDNIIQMSCGRTEVLYRVTCSVTIDNITSANRAGRYSIVVANDLGALDLNLTITFNESPPPSPPGNSEPWAAVGGGIAGIAVAIVVAVLVVFIRRQRQGSNSTGSNQAGNGSLLKNMDGKSNRQPEDETMIVNSLYGTALGTAAHGCQTRTPQHSDYEDVGLPGATKPQIQPKPQFAAKISTAKDEKDTYSVVQKGSKPANNPADTAEYASVDKSKTVCDQDGEATVRTETTALNKYKATQKPDKKPKPAKYKFKGKARKEKKEEKQKLRKRPEHAEGAVYGNMPLSMNPIDSKVYENFGFQNEELETKPRDPPRVPAAQPDANNEGLVYTTIQFTESQQKKAEHNPPKRETTEYVSIVFNKQPSSISGD